MRWYDDLYGYNLLDKKETVMWKIKRVNNSLINMSLHCLLMIMML